VNVKHLTIAVVALVCTAPAANAAADVRINHWGTGAVATFSVCTPLGDGDQFCEDRFVSYFADYGTAGERGGHSGPELLYEHYAAFIPADGEADEVVAEIGFTDDAPGAYDRSSLSFARSSGATMDLYDVSTGDLVPNGRMVTLGPFEWTPASGIYVFGNDGPFGFGLPRHYVDRCVTAIENAHERFTTAHVTGTIDGVSVTNYGPGYLPWPGTGPPDALGAIFDNRFTVRVVSHSPVCS
jgi:hypothetical protein